MPQQAVALTQAPVHIYPQLVEALFHVEHAPIQKLPTNPRSALEQVKRR